MVGIIVASVMSDAASCWTMEYRSGFLCTAINGLPSR